MSETVAPAAPIGSTSLPFKGFFAEFKRRKIQYCSWKSTLSLEAGLRGNTDIDLLIEKTQARQAESVLHRHGFRRAYLPGRAGAPGIEDWIGFDAATGKIFHLHVHYQIFAGLKGIKEYRLPWEKIILGTRVQHRETKVWVIDPNLEIIILLVRMALKTNSIEIFWCFVRKKEFLADMYRELNWLKARTNETDVRRYAVKLLGEKVGASFVAKVFEATSNNRILLYDLRKQARARLGPYCRHDRIQLMFHRLEFLVNAVWERFRRLLGIRSRRKRIHSGGRIIAIIGADGAGKSTIANDLVKSLTWKLDTQYYYLGEGSGSFAGVTIGYLHRNLKKLFGTILDKHKANGITRLQSIAERKENNGPFARILKSAKEHVFALSRIILVWERQQKLFKLQRARTNGSIVVTDRYPQSCIVGLFDGPRFCEGNEEKSLLLRFAAKEERKFYEYARRMGPDLVVRLHVTEDIAFDRKPGHKRETIRRKIDAMPHIHFTDANNVDIDAVEPLENVKLKVKSWVWENI